MHTTENIARISLLSVHFTIGISFAEIFHTAPKIFQPNKWNVNRGEKKAYESNKQTKQRDSKIATHEPARVIIHFCCKAVAALKIKKILLVEICSVAFGSTNIAIQCDAFTFTCRTIQQPHHSQTAKHKNEIEKKRNYINYSSDEPNSCNALHFAFLCFAVHLHKYTLLAIRLIWIAATYSYWNLFTIFFLLSFTSSFLASSILFLHFTAFSSRNTRNILTGYELIQITLFGFDFEF